MSTLEYINKLETDLDKEANLSCSLKGQLHDLKNKNNRYEQILKMIINLSPSKYKLADAQYIALLAIEDEHI